MDWLENLNKSLEYVENHLTDELSIDEAARIAHCSTYHYQRMFSYIADVTLGEYIRRRRMSLAVVDLKNGAKVIDVAIKYGYESPTSFNRAFRSVHGISPQEAKRADSKLTSYPLLNFAIQVKGVTAMEYQIIDKESFKIVGPSLTLGKDMEKNQKIIPQFWTKFHQENGLAKLLPLMGEKVPGILGVSMMDDYESDEWDYVIAVASDQEVEGFKTYDIPAAKWAIFSGSGPMPHAIQELQKRIYVEWLPTSGYEYAELPDIEVYLDHDPTNPSFQVWFPVRIKSDN